jgi:hypothetical protein
MASPNQDKAADKQEAQKNYKGFVAGVFSGVSKLTGKCNCHVICYPSRDFLIIL